MKKLLKKIFIPNKIIGFLSFNLAFILLIYVFSTHIEKTSLAYFSYLLSTYALIVFCIWFFKVCLFGNETFKKTYLYKFYQNNLLMITKMILSFSLILNLIYGIFNLVTGIYYMSWWFITFSGYYLLLFIMKVSLVRDIKNEVDIDLRKANKKLKKFGIALLFINIILSGIITLIIIQNQTIHYNGILIYIVALYDFVLIIGAIINITKYRKNNSPILIASKCINLTVAMISMISLEVAMIYQFGNNDLFFKSVMTGIMGFVICIINTVMSIYMILKANKALNQSN